MPETITTEELSIMADRVPELVDRVCLAIEDGRLEQVEELREKARALVIGLEAALRRRIV